MGSAHDKSRQTSVEAAELVTCFSWSAMATLSIVHPQLPHLLLQRLHQAPWRRLKCALQGKHAHICSWVTTLLGGWGGSEADGNQTQPASQPSCPLSCCWTDTKASAHTLLPVSFRCFCTNPITSQFTAATNCFELLPSASFYFLLSLRMPLDTTALPFFEYFVVFFSPVFSFIISSSLTTACWSAYQSCVNNKFIRTGHTLKVVKSNLNRWNRILVLCCSSSSSSITGRCASRARTSVTALHKQI